MVLIGWLCVDLGDESASLESVCVVMASACAVSVYSLWTMHVQLRCMVMASACAASVCV